MNGSTWLLAAESNHPFGIVVGRIYIPWQIEKATAYKLKTCKINKKKRGSSKTNEPYVTVKY